MHREHIKLLIVHQSYTVYAIDIGQITNAEILVVELQSP